MVYPVTHVLGKTVTGMGKQTDRQLNPENVRSNLRMLMALKVAQHCGRIRTADLQIDSHKCFRSATTPALPQRQITAELILR